ncbi:hypothetical protein ACU686_21505 [Yinghuangia aomiensis]
MIVPQVWAMEWVALSDPGKLRVIGMSHESFQASQASSRFGRVKRYFSDVDLLLPAPPRRTPTSGSRTA